MTQTAELTASDGAANDYLGLPVAISGDTIVAGVPFHKVGSNSKQGAAYVFVMPSSGWATAPHPMTQTAELTASDGAAGDDLGGSVAISGSTVVAGAGGHKVGSSAFQGAAYVFFAPLPTPAIAAPANGASYTQGQVVRASYACSAPTGATITACAGTAPNGQPINTSTLGAHTFTVAATASDGQFVAKSITYTVIKPTLSGLRVSPHRLSIAGREVKRRCVKATRKNSSHKHCRLKIKLKISYTLNGPATVTFTLKLKMPGRKAAGRCVKPTRHNHKHKKCTRLVPIHRSIVKAGAAGTNSFTWGGKIADQALASGTYQLTATPTGGQPHTTTFTIVG